MPMLRNPVSSLPVGRGSVRHPLGRWLAVRMVAVMGVASAVLLVICYLALSALFDAFEHAAAKEELTRVQAVLLKDSQTLGEMTQDYARWDDTYKALEGDYPDYLDDNFTTASLRNLRVQGVVLVGMQGQVLGERQLADADLQVQLDLDWRRALVGDDPLGLCAGPRDSMVWLQDTALMVARIPINNTAVTRQPRGCLVFAREMNADYFESVQPFTGVSAGLQRQTTGEAAQWRQSDGQWVAQAPLALLPGVLRIEHRPLLGAHRSQVIALVTTALALITLLAVGALFWLVQRQVVHRLRHAADLADRYSLQPDPSIAWSTRGDDEIARLGGSLNELVAQVHAHAAHTAVHDSLTGLLNRRGLEALLRDMPFHAHEQRHQMACLILLDLDNFKTVNDGFGHDVGDALLRHVTSQLLHTVRHEDTVARIGGDEFAVLLHGPEREPFLALACRLLENLRIPLVHGELEVATSASIGVAFSDVAHSGSDLLRNADLAMYQAKQQGRNSWVVFNESLQVDAQRRSRLSQSLRRALDEQALQVAYQPVVDMVTHQVVSIEALARWSLEGEVISPAEFIPIAEESGLIGRLGMQILSRSCALLAHLRSQGHDITCSVNLSLRQFTEFDLCKELPQVVAAHGLPASAIRLEITESLVGESDPAVMSTIRALHALGFEFMLDDFGTGQSSLHRLQALPCQTLKIDRSFVTPLERGDTVMVRSVVDLAHALNLSLVAEGVETRAQLAQLLALGVSRIQGFLTARPMSDMALQGWLETVRRQGGFQLADFPGAAPAAKPR